MFRHANPTRFIICRRCYPLSYKLLWFLTQFRCEHGQIQVAVLVVVVVVSYCKKNRELISTCDEKKIRHQVVFSASVQSNRQKTESSSATSKPQTVAILNFLSQRPGGQGIPVFFTCLFCYDNLFLELNSRKTG